MSKIVILAVVGLMLATQGAGQKSPVFAPGGKAINGYDPVAFFTEQKAVKGVDSIAYPWQGATWYFSNRRNLDSFVANPASYAPQYGGYCAYGTAEGHKAPTEADTWTIVKDRLYFNYNRKVKESWLRDRDSLIKRADVNWGDLQDRK